MKKHHPGRREEAVAHPEPPTLIVAPPLHPVEIAHRAYVALRHQPIPHGVGFTCLCGARLPCPAVTALLADIAADWTRIQDDTSPGPDTGTDTATLWRKP
jgi:hypothetical protein